MLEIEANVYNCLKACTFLRNCAAYYHAQSKLCILQLFEPFDQIKHAEPAHVVKFIERHRLTWIMDASHKFTDFLHVLNTLSQCRLFAILLDN